MHPPALKTALPWLIGLSLAATGCCLAVAIHFAMGARADAVMDATQQVALQGDALARQIDSDLGLFDQALHIAAGSGVNAPAAGSKAAFLELPLTARYVGFINVLNEAGDVVADSRSNVSRPLNFIGRDYFQDHLKNPADVLMIGRPFATAPNQHPSIPVSRRLHRPDGGFSGVVVAGVRLAWLSDLLARPAPGPLAKVTIRRADGLILMPSSSDADPAGHRSANDPAWQEYLRTGLSPTAGDSNGIRLFRKLEASPLVLDLFLADESVARSERSALMGLSILAVVPLLCVISLSLAAHRLFRRGLQIEEGAGIANEERVRLLANMSHELRTPLTGILGQAELLTNEGDLNERQTGRLAKLTAAGDLMRHIVDRVVDIARPDGASDTAVLSACDMDPLIRGCIDIVQGEARRKGLQLTRSIDPGVPRTAMLDAVRVQQVVINLLMNAVKFTDYGTVALRVSGTSTLLRFEVADTGPGIPVGKRHRLFRAYDRLGAQGGKGAGLGLSITDGFVRTMGGQIGFTENAGGGALFWIELPIAVPDALTTSPPEVLAPSGTSLPAPPQQPRALTILVADDLDLTRSIAADFLRAAGHWVIEVADGEAAVAAVRGQDFDVVLTDMRMPVVDGLEVTRRIRALPGHRGRTPVVLVTADMIAIRAGESGRTGVDVCVRKPFTRAELFAAVATAARLTPKPDQQGTGDQTLEACVLAELHRNLGDEPFAAHLDAAAQRIGELITLLERPNAYESPVVADAVHDLVGVAGLLGLNALALSLRWFDTSPDRKEPAAALHKAAVAALQALDRHPLRKLALTA